MGATLRCGERKESRRRTVYRRRLAETRAGVHQRLFLELPIAEPNRAQILRRSSRRAIPLGNRVRCRDGGCAGVDLSENDRFPGRPYHHLPAEKLNRGHPKSLFYQLSYGGGGGRDIKRLI